MKILVTGASGFIGAHLCASLLSRNHQVIGLGRSAAKSRIVHPRYRFVAADTTRPGPWQQDLSELDAVINLAGKSIFGRWTEAVKNEIRESRILTTRHVAQGLAPGQGTTFISASGVGFYGSRGDDVLTEDDPAGQDFLARLSVDWEGEALIAAEKSARVVLMRLGVVLGEGGGAMAQMIPAFKSFVGGPIGNGRQWFPWIQLEDLTAAVHFLLARPGISGPVNLCAPNPVQNRDLAAALGKALSRPAFMPAPAFVIRLALGEFAQVLLGSQRAVPQKLRQHKFSFRYPDIQAAVQAVIHPSAV
jgi:uncharacterized protein (TIGR01777 family)